MRDPRAILLENALIDTRNLLNFSFPPSLRSEAEPGCYIVQARNPLTAVFQRTLVANGATPISYIPNNACLVRMSAAVAQRLAADPAVASVLPYEPYYKIKSSLLDLVLALDSGSDVAETKIAVRVLLFNDAQDNTLVQLKEGGLAIASVEPSPFGVVATTRCSPEKLAWIARLDGVQEIELDHQRVSATDLSRATIGVAPGPVNPANYLGLSGSNILVNVIDSGVDTNQPDLAGRVQWDLPASGTDSNGHGTHIAGVIAGSGSQSLSVSNAPGSPMPPSPLQFRGVAPAARLFSIATAPASSLSGADSYVQQTAARSAALISNNSWHYAGDNDYDLGAASYDAAVRDALPTMSGSQPLLFVFAAGNTGHGADDGTGGVANSIQSPGTAKNVITVGALEQLRLITNQTWSCSSNGTGASCQTNAPWLSLTDSSNQVASYSSRGNVAPGIEGATGRFKPDIVAPGTFVISARSTTWNQAAYYSLSNNFFNLSPDANYEQVLSNLDIGLGPFYRFESGTSVAAAEVSGTLALIQEFFEHRLLRTNSPALMKALLLNGARALQGGYDPRSPGATNVQGWGLVRLPGSLPASLTNAPSSAAAMLAFDQSPGEALFAGQQRTRLVSVAAAARNVPFRVTLAWTDPPGNPVAGVKLVNDLDLIVTNLDTGAVYWGNDFNAGAQFNSAWQPGNTPNSDLVNNVENVFLAPPLGSRYSVTVLVHRIGVNAVSERTDELVQDYALVISSGDGQISDALNLTDSSLSTGSLPGTTFITNTFSRSSSDFGTVLLHQRVSAFGTLPATNVIGLPGSSNAVITIGSPQQWHFYVFTNDSPYTNAVFLTFQGRSLAAAPAWTDFGNSNAPGQVWLPGADVDLYVSRDAALTNLDPNVLAAADMSLSRGANEAILYSNATPGLYYIGVKCESSEGTEYGLVVDLSQHPFVQVDGQGDELLRGFPEPAVVPNGSASLPGQAYTFYVTPDSLPVRRAILTNLVSVAAVGDRQLTLAHGDSTVVLHNHSTNAPLGTQTFIYDDSGEGDINGALLSDGPGSLRSFAGHDAAGLWVLTTSTTNQAATNLASSIFIEQQQDLAGAIAPTILPGACRQDYLAVPLSATNVTVLASIMPGTGPASIQVFPLETSPSNCPSILIDSSGVGTVLSVDDTSHPPLQPGLYIVRTCNLGQNPMAVTIQGNSIMAPVAPLPNVYNSTQSQVIPDNAVSTSAIRVTNTDPVLLAEVGVRIEHPRVSDLVLTLIAPDGTRVLLQDMRGGSSSDGLGSSVVVTNSTPVSFSGGPVAVTNTFDSGETAGTILINYDFFALPDEMRLYYENNLLFDSGLVSFRGSTNVNYGPGNATSFTIVMNQGGNPQPNTSWFYSVTSTHHDPLDVIFTENTNLTITPIKFAPAPLTNFTFSPADGLLQQGIFYLPEQSLDKLAGKPAYGQWMLEVRDARAGATNPPPTLVNWQLALWLANSQSVPIQLVHSQQITNLIGPGEIQVYQVAVPDYVSFSTNTLLNSSAPVNVLFNPIAPPTGTNASDTVLAVGSISGAWTLQTNASPGLLPGSSYFLAIQNTNPSTVSVSLVIDFDAETVITLSAATPYAKINPGPLNSSDFYRYVVSLDAVRVQFEVNGPTSDVTLVARKGPPLPSLSSYDFISANPGTNDEQIVIYDYSRPVPLNGEWFLTVVNVTGSPAAYTIMATEFQDYGTNLVLSGPTVDTNGICFSWNSLPGIHYVLQGKINVTEADWTNLSSTITASDYTTGYCLSSPSPFAYFRVVESLALVPAIPIISTVTAVSRGTLLQWTDPTNLTFQVQWTPALVPANWQPFSARVTSTTGIFQFLDDGSQTGGLSSPRFYRLRQEP